MLSERVVTAVRAADVEGLHRAVIEQGPAVLEGRDALGASVVGVAFRAEQFGMAIAAIELGADPEAVMETRDAFRFRPLHVAVRDANEGLVRALLDAGAWVDGLTGAGEAALVLVVDQGWVDGVRVLLEAGADPNLRSKAQKPFPTVLHRAAHAGREDLVRLLLDGGASVHEATTRGTTALMTAAMCGHLGCCRALIEGGADPLRARPSGESAVDFAQLDGAVALVDFLESAQRKCAVRVTRCGSDEAGHTGLDGPAL